MRPTLCEVADGRVSGGGGGGRRTSPTFVQGYRVEVCY
jgi:hypothetical protein